jgi:hypothetical protein
MRQLFALVVAASSLLYAAPAGAAQVFGYTGSMVSWIVPNSGTYQIIGNGAQGGAGGSDPFAPGGAGAEVTGDIALISGQVLDIVVGGAGATNPDFGGGGGGATWLFTQNASAPLLVAAGGGGNNWLTLPGDSEALGGTGQAQGGPGSGQGGAGGGPAIGPGGGGGAGWLSNGGNAPSAGEPNGFGGHGPGSFAGGTTQGPLVMGFDINLTTGGYGGGGGAGYNGGGGGGGYTGGAGGVMNGGQGGKSYLDPRFTDGTGASGENLGNGELTISELSPAPEPSAWALWIAGLAIIGGGMRLQWRGLRA